MLSPHKSKAPPAHVLDVSTSGVPIIRGHLNLGGTNPQGQSIEFTSYYMLRDGVPCIPVMGEFHFSRYAHLYWEDELLKMKAGGVDIVASYVFWIHIEEEEGIFDWSDNNNLRQFISLCARHQLQAIVRIGPFAHGECRNGGLPDWLYGRPFPVRSNDERYLASVLRLYQEISAQLEGLLFKDNGPVVGIQLENEYMHCGAPWEVTFRQGTEWVPSGSDGAEHIMALKRLALDAGLEVPIYTCTGWLRSPIPEGEVLPMQGGYVFQPWNPDPDYRQPPTREFLFRNRHLEPVLGGKPTYEAAKYPYACCELGGGIQDTYYHRDIVPPEAVEALAVMNLAGGANLLGYYMYHGGSNPVGKHSYLNEFTVPRISYDFQAPLREFGQFAESFGRLRLLHTFLRDFGHILAPMSVVVPDDASAITPENTSDLRFAARSKDGAGFLFLNNYQDHVETQDITDVNVRIQAANEVISIPPLTLQKDVSAILPFNLRLDGVLLKYATTQLFARIGEGETIDYFFFAPRGMVSEYAFDASTFRMLAASNGEVSGVGRQTYVTVTPGTGTLITLTNLDGKTIRLFTLTREQAEKSSRQTLWDRERLVISDGTLVTAGDGYTLYWTGQGEVSVSIYPAVEGTLSTPFSAFTETADGHFTRYTTKLPDKALGFEMDKIGADRAILRFAPDILDGLDNVWLRIDYVGDIGSLFVDGRLVHDNFYNGTTWEIGLKHFAQYLADKELFVMISPATRNSGALKYVPTGMAFRPSSDGERLAVINSVTVVSEYKIPLSQAR